MHRVEALPAQAREEDLRPGMQVTASVGGIGVRLVSTDEPGRDPKAAAGLHEKHGQIAASPAAGRKRVRGGLGGAFGPDMAVHSGEQGLIEAREEV